MVKHAWFGCLGLKGCLSSFRLTSLFKKNVAEKPWFMTFMVINITLLPKIYSISSQSRSSRWRSITTLGKNTKKNSRSSDAKPVIATLKKIIFRRPELIIRCFKPWVISRTMKLNGWLKKVLKKSIQSVLIIKRPWDCLGPQIIIKTKVIFKKRWQYTLNFSVTSIHEKCWSKRRKA